MNAFEPEAFDTGKRIYTDDRFPAIEVVNEGGPLFTVYQRNLSGVLEAIDDFSGFEVAGKTKVSEGFAHRRALTYFNMLAASNIPDVALFEDEVKPEHPSTQDVDAIIAEARVEQNPQRAAELRKQALRQMSFESVAQLLVDRALDQ